MRNALGPVLRPSTYTRVVALILLASLSVAPSTVGAGDDGPDPLDGAAATDIDVILTADNAYGLGVGTADQIDLWFGAVENTTAAQIFNGPLGNGPEGYTLMDASAGGYLYVVAWSDDAVTQGVLGQFQVLGETTVYTGEGSWRVFATGIDLDVPSGGPTLETVNEQIAIANAGSGAAETSGGWVAGIGGGLGNLAYGEDNSSAGGDFQLAAIIDSGARWMWFNRDPDTLHAFGDGNHKEFLIFRLALNQIPGVGVDAFGNSHEALGSAAVQVNGSGHLEATGLGDGTSGLRVTLEDRSDDQGWIRFQSVWQETPFEEGESVTLEAFGSTADGPEELQGELVLRREGAGIKLRTAFPTCSEMRIVITNLGVVAVDRGGLVFVDPGPAPLPSKAEGVVDVDVILHKIPSGKAAGGVDYGVTALEGFGAADGAALVVPNWQVNVGDPVDIVLDGTTYVGDSIQVIGQKCLEPIVSANRIEARTVGITSLVWSDELTDAGLAYGAMPVRGQGATALFRTRSLATVAEELIVVAEESPLVATAVVELGESTNVQVQVTDLDLEATSAGDSQCLRGTGHDAGGDVDLGEVCLVADGVDGFDIVTDLTPLAGVQNLNVFVDGALVATVSNQAQQTVATAPQVHGLEGMGTVEFPGRFPGATAGIGGGDDFTWYHLGWEDLVAIQIAGGPTVMGRELVIEADTPLVDTRVAAVSLELNGPESIALGRLQRDFLFVDGFESGDTARWSSVVP